MKVNSYRFSCYIIDRANLTNEPCHFYKLSIFQSSINPSLVGLLGIPDPALEATIALRRPQCFMKRYKIREVD